MPEFSPICPKVRTSQIAKCEVHLVYTNTDGEEEYAELQDVKPHASWKDIENMAGGGFYEVVLKNEKMRMLGRASRRILAQPKFLKELRAAEKAELEDGDDGRDSMSSAFKSATEMMTAMMGAMGAMMNGGGGGNSGAMVQQMMAQLQQTQMMMSMNATQMTSMQAAHTAEVERYRARIVDLERELQKINGENLGMTRELITSKSPTLSSQVTDLMPKLVPTLRGLKELMNDAPAGAAGAGRVVHTMALPK